MKFEATLWFPGAKEYSYVHASWFAYKHTWSTCPHRIGVNKDTIHMEPAGVTKMSQ